MVPAIGPVPAGHRSSSALAATVPPSDPSPDAAEPADWVFPASWRRSGLAWWVMATAAAAGLVATVHTGLPFQVELVLSAGLFTIPALAVSRLLVRRSHPSLRGTWWAWLYGLRCFFVFGYLSAVVKFAEWLMGHPPGTAAWATTRLVAGVFGAAALVCWGLVIRDTLRNGMGGRDRSEIAIDLVMAAVVVSGPALSFSASFVPQAISPVESALVKLGPLAAAFGIVAGIFWCAHVLMLLRDTAGLRAMSVDGLDLVTVTVALAASPLIALVPALAHHQAVLWLTLPFVFLAAVLPGVACGALMLMARVAARDRRTARWLLAFLVVSVGDLWAQVAMALARYRLPAVPFIVAGCANFGLFLILPLVEQRRRIDGLGRLAPTAQLRRWDIVPAVAAASVLGLLAQLDLGAGSGPGPGIGIAGALCVLVLLGSARHYANVRETRRLHRQVVQMTAELYSQSRVDPLTGLGNRRTLIERFPQIAASCARTGRPLSVAMIDLDDFKLFNDRYGHLAGDDVLSDLARLVRSVLRDEDLAARFGGEEICLVLPGAEPEQGAAVLERLRQDHGAMHAASRWHAFQAGRPPVATPAFAVPVGVGIRTGVAASGGTVPAQHGAVPAGAAVSEHGTRRVDDVNVAAGSFPGDSPPSPRPPAGSSAPVTPTEPSTPGAVTFSAGVARWRPGEQLDDVLRRADAACYAAKAAGRDRIVVDQPEERAH